jgi:hypothetical protein
MSANLDLAGIPDGMLQPHIILPSQHFAPHRKPAPEHRLMIAVLQDALNSLERYRAATGHRGRRLFREVTQWLLSEETDWPFSFERICEVLALDSNAVRHHLHLAPERQLIRVPCQVHIANRETAPQNR